MKPGYQTTEFWLTVATMLFAIIEKGFDITLPKDPLFGIIAYVFTRGYIKSKSVTKI